MSRNVIFVLICHCYKLLDLNNIEEGCKRFTDYNRALVTVVNIHPSLTLCSCNHYPATSAIFLTRKPNARSKSMALNISGYGCVLPDEVVSEISYSKNPVKR
jgi:hypothetical protein